MVFIVASIKNLWYSSDGQKEETQMLKLMCAALCAAFAIPSVAAAAPESIYGLGGTVTYDGLVEDPDVSIVYVALDPDRSAATLFVRYNDGTSDAYAVTLSVGDTRSIVVDRECDESGRCTVSVLDVRFTQLYDESIFLDEEIRILRGFGSPGSLIRVSE